jgi:hypothetical protein
MIDGEAVVRDPNGLSTNCLVLPDAGFAEDCVGGRKALRFADASAVAKSLLRV